jgi:spore germination cell wall hydrolase CwlJ-like protein
MSVVKVRGARALSAIALAAAVLAFTTPASAADSKSELRCLATAIYFEARGESERGQRAIADVVIARTKSGEHPLTICGVVYEGSHHRACQFSFACDGRSERKHEAKCWERAKRIAAEALEDDQSTVRDATYFHIKSIHPRWATHMIRVAAIGAHVFYRPRHSAALYASR